MLSNHAYHPAWEAGAVLDERWIRSLHVETLRKRELHGFAEQGDLGWGTLNGLDGEMIALDG